MISQSTRATTAAESRFRINNPNSRARSSLVLGLGKATMPTLLALSGMEWNGARFSCVMQAEDDDGSAPELEIGPKDLLLQAPNGEVSRLSDELTNTDVVIMFARSGDPAQAAATVGKAAFSRNLMTAGFVLDEHHDRQGLEKTLSAMRPFVISLVVGSDEESFSETLSAIRA